MAKNKTKEYLPLRWCKKLEMQSKISVGDMTIDEMRILSCGGSFKEKYSVIMKYPVLDSFFKMASRDAKSPMSTLHPELGNGEAAVMELLSDIDAIYNVRMWGLNKQVFKFDKDFSDELIRTENTHMIKDMFDYLPYKHFYVDISENRKLCEEIYCDGFFVYVEKGFYSDDNKFESDLYKIHVCKLTDMYFFNDTFIVKNEDGERERLNPDDSQQLNVQRFDEKNSKFITSKVSVNSKVYENIVFQILSYLSSVEPDIADNVTTKETYHKPNSNMPPKHKFSEIQAHDVGVRFGSAFRKWESESRTVYKNSGSGTGKKKRPHTRRAHWSHYWYKLDNGERVLRPKWLEATFIGLDKDKDKQPAVIHKVKNKAKDEDIDR